MMQNIIFVLRFALNDAVITQVKTTTRLESQRRRRGGCVIVVIDGMTVSWGDDIPPPALALKAAPFSPYDETFAEGSPRASFTEAAGNNIVPTFRCVRSHITGCSIRNGPHCGTINLMPPAADLCSNRPALANKSNLEGGSNTLSPAGYYCPMDHTFIGVHLSSYSNRGHASIRCHWSHWPGENLC